MSFIDALSDSEVDELAAFLANHAVMTMEELDGYFAALICSPQYMSMTEYFPQIMGEDFSFPSNHEAERIIKLLFRHWNAMTDQLQRSVEQNDVLYLPLLYQNADGIAYGNEWASGFMHGTRLSHRDWKMLLDDENHGGSLIPMMMLANEHHADPEMRPPPISPEKREDIQALMTAGVIQIFRYFAPYREAFAQDVAEEGTTPFRRVGPKIGRNDPCPCGSGKKYKACCGSSRTVH